MYMDIKILEYELEYEHLNSEQPLNKLLNERNPWMEKPPFKSLIFSF